MPFDIPASVALSKCMGVGGWVWPNFSSVSRMVWPSFAFMKRVTSYASTAEYAMNFMMFQRVYIASFRQMGALSRGIHPRKKCPDTRLLASLSEAHYASKWMLRNTSDA